MATTRLGQIGVGVAEYPVESEPSEPPPEVDVGLLTRLGQIGVGVARYAYQEPPEEPPEEPPAEDEETDVATVRGNLYWASGLRRKGADEEVREEYDEEDDAAALLLVS